MQREKDLENSESKHQQLIKRIEVLQKKNEASEAAKSQASIGWGSIFSSGATANLKEEYDKLNELYQVAQEDLQIKIEEIGKLPFSPL